MRRIPRLIGSLVVVSLTVVFAGPSSAGVVVTPGGVRFTHVAPNASSVALAGSFNDWSSSANPMVREGDSIWSTVVRLGTGVHEYKFVVDGEWIADPDNPVTTGSYGNSAIQLGADGQLKEMEATSNTPYNTAIRMGGRFRSLFQAYQNPGQDDRFELRRPLFDIDLDFGATINDVLSARLLLKVNNEAENVDVWKTRLNFDRGHIAYDAGGFAFKVWDNEGAVRFDDPMMLVGGVGIYAYDLGYLTQGIAARHRFGPLKISALYADNILDGNLNPPPVPVTVPAPTNIVLAGDTFLPAHDSVYDYQYAWFNEDIAAARAKLDLILGFELGASGRYDRGYNAAAFGRLDPATIAPDTLALELTAGDTTAVPGVSYLMDAYTGWEEWWGAGLDLQNQDMIGPIDVQIGGLYGRSNVVTREGTRSFVFLGTVTDPDTTFATFVDGTDDRITDETRRVEPVPIGTTEEQLAESVRLRAAVDDFPFLFGMRFGAAAEWHGVRHSSLATGTREVENDALLYTAYGRWSILDRLHLGLEGEAWDFHYDEKTPWRFQFWFDDRNFWLENGFDKVKYERLTFLGGDDAIFLRPSIGLDLFARQRLRLRWDGTVAATGIDRVPKYHENLFKAWFDLTDRWTFYGDVRAVRYDDPVLDMQGTFGALFLEAKWKVFEDAEIALSWGVDPYVLDPITNEYDEIGRDHYLFDRGANVDTARDNFGSLSTVIPDAERQLMNERVIQIEAVVKY